MLHYKLIGKCLFRDNIYEYFDAFNLKYWYLIAVYDISFAVNVTYEFFSNNHSARQA